METDTPGKLPHLTPAQCRMVDEYAVKALGIPGIVLMENAGLNLANLILDVMHTPDEDAGFGAAHVIDRPVYLFCGGGNNGGDGFTAARHLHNHGVKVMAFQYGDEAKMPADCKTQYDIARKLNLVQSHEREMSLPPQAILADCLLGTGFSGHEDTEVREPIASAIHQINQSKADAGDGTTVIAADIPSGLNGLTGKAATPTVTADITMTFAAKKTGFEQVEARRYMGQVVIGDIGIPDSVINAVHSSER